jgi:hypothetical protein
MKSCPNFKTFVFKSLVGLSTVFGWLVPASVAASDRVVVPSDRELSPVLPLLWIAPAVEISGTADRGQGQPIVEISVVPDKGIELTSQKGAEFLHPALAIGTKLALVRGGANAAVYCDLRVSANVRRCFGDSKNSGTLDYVCTTKGGGTFQTSQLPTRMQYGTMGVGICMPIDLKNRATYRPIAREAFTPDTLWFKVERGYVKWDYRLNWGFKNQKGEYELIGLAPFKWNETDQTIVQRFGGLTLELLRPSEVGKPVMLRIQSIDANRPLGCFSPISRSGGGPLMPETTGALSSLCLEKLALQRFAREAAAPRT